ncbi:hypothetical protein ACLB2K_068787 [Fragaria x ananassa]
MAAFGRAFPFIAYKQKQPLVFGSSAYHYLLPKARLLKPEKRKPGSAFCAIQPREETPLSFTPEANLPHIDRKQLLEEDQESEMAVWNERLLEVFCDLCIKEVDKNNRPHTHFNAEGWTNIINGFEQETGKSYTKKQLKNKWDALKSELRSWKELKGKETGLGWDHRLQTIDAPDEWWRAKIEKVKEYAKFRKKGIAPDFEAKLDMMFGGTTTTGEHAYAPSSSLPIPRSLEQVNNLESSGDSKEDDQPKNLPKRRSERTKKDKGVVQKRKRLEVLLSWLAKLVECVQQLKVEVQQLQWPVEVYKKVHAIVLPK